MRSHEEVRPRILIDNGEVFDGTLEQFRDCFYSNATLENIPDWCRDNGHTYEFITTVKLSDGYYKVSDEAVAKFGPELLDKLNRGDRREP
jgi:hypothetical protein